MLQKFEVRFGTLLKLIVEQQYYRQTQAEDLVLVPTPTTAQTLQQAHMAINEYEGASFITFSYDHSNAIAYHMERKDTLLLSFYLYNTNPYFKNIIDLTEGLTNQVFYFHNKDTKNAYLHPKEAVTADSLYPLAGDHLPWAASKAGATVTLLDSEDKSLEEFKADKEGTAHVDLTERVAGLYTLKEGNKTVHTFMYIPTNHHLYNRGSILGKVDITVHKNAKQDFLEILQGKQAHIPLDYKVSFGTKKVYWRYIIVLKYRGTLKGFEIESKTVNFKKPEKVKLGDKEALVFTSTEPLALYDIPVHECYFSLDDKGKKDDKGRRSMLPIPSPDSIKEEKIEGKQALVADIYFYL